MNAAEKIDFVEDAQAMQASLAAAQRVADSDHVLRLNHASAAWLAVELARGDVREARWMAFYRSATSGFWAHVVEHLDRLIAEEDTILVVSEGSC